MTENVVQFPNRSSLSLTQSEADIGLQNIRENMLSQVAGDVANMVYNQLDGLGFDVFNEDCFNDAMFVQEAITCLLMRSQGLEYFMHEMVDEIFDFDEDDLPAE